MSSDQQQREQALDPSRSFIVEAPAGSGKTSLLIHRYLRLLSSVDRPESVVAMTFTRKAAADIRERVLAALQGAQTRGAPQAIENDHDRRTRDLAVEALAQNQKKGWNLSANTNRLQIQTIDSLCTMLTRQMPVVSGFGGITEVVEDATALYRLAARRTIRRLAEGNQAAKALFRSVSLHFDNDMALLEAQIVGMLKKRDQWRFLRSEQRGPLVENFCELLARAHEELTEVFRRHSKVDFTEVTRAAIKALGEGEQPTDLLYRLDYRITHLLVDEFQDTSLAQYQLLRALTAEWSGGDEHSLFLVGDPMQSIYRFREAEVSLFLQCWENESLGSVPLTPLRLTTNFRTTPEILAWVQEKFSPIMDKDDTVHGGVRFRSSKADRPKSKLAPCVTRFVDDDGEKEASAVVKIANGARRRGSVAILVRSRTHIADILSALRASDIPYEAIEIDQLKEQQHILDLISLTRAILHVGDRLAWLACLRAPWCGLKLDDLAALAENEPERTILDLLSDPEKIAALSPDGRMRAVRNQEILSAAVANAGRVPLRDLVESAWMALGGPAILAQPNQQQDADTYFCLLESFEQGGAIRDFSLLYAPLEYLYAQPEIGKDRVQVMTIHQAKGLEFDTVIVPQLGRSAKPTDRELVIWTEEFDEKQEPRLLVAAQPQRGCEDAAYDYISKEIKQKDEHELKRLFYVACTRAKNELYLLGNVRTKKSGAECRDATRGTFLHLIWPFEKRFFESELHRPTPAQGNLFPENGREKPERALRRLPATWHLPRFDEAVEWRPKFRPAIASAREITYDWASDTSRHVGTVVHELLNLVAREGVDAWNSARIESRLPMIKSELLQLGVAREQWEHASGQVTRALNNTLRSTRGRWILASHADARSEWAIAGAIQDELVTGIVDRTFRDEQGRSWIIDFKTGEHGGGEVEAFLDDEKNRYRKQLESYGTLMAKMVPGPIWLGLYFPLLDGWREWQLQEEAIPVYAG